jgi:hypothetical protein
VDGLWAGVRERVEVLAGQSVATRVFGASVHGFTLDAPLTEEQLLDWETRVGMTLPSQYRSFLTVVAAAGAGPFYGLLGFRVTDGIAHWVGDAWRGPEQLNLRVEFPHLDEFLPIAWDTLPGIEEDQFPTPAAYAEAERRRAELVQVLKDRERTETYGTIPLSHQGCGYYDLLVVNGPDAGHVWVDNRVVDGPISPYVEDSGRVTFDRWYLTWLADAEDLCARLTGP